MEHLIDQVDRVLEPYLYACQSRRCNRSDAVYTDDSVLHYHTRRPYIVWRNVKNIRPEVFVVPVDREYGLYANMRHNCMVRFTVAR